MLRLPLEEDDLIFSIEFCWKRMEQEAFIGPDQCHSPDPFFFIFFFSTKLLNKCSFYKIADDWIWNADLLNCKRPLYQLSHNHSHMTCSVLIDTLRS